MSSRAAVECSNPTCACVHHGGFARHLVYGEEYVARPVVHRAATGVPKQDRSAVRAENTARVQASLAAREAKKREGSHTKLTDRSPA